MLFTSLMYRLAQAKKRTRPTLVIFLSAVLTTAFTHTIYANDSKALSGVKNEISRQTNDLKTQQKQLDRLQNQLKKEELSIHDIAKQINKTRSKLNEANTAFTSTNRKVSVLEQEYIQQQKQLATLIDLYYLTRSHKHPLSHLNPDKTSERITHYYQHLAQARSEQLENIEITKQTLVTEQEKRKHYQHQMSTLLTKQTTERELLSQLQNKRKQTLTQLRKSISSDRVYLNELKRNEQRLLTAIKEAKKRNQVKMDGLSHRKGKLSWPIKGRTLHRYGSKQSSQLTWKGMVIAAHAGSPVKAVDAGTVVFANYLRGYGLVLLLDHGKGEMTLYGYNQSLLKSEGDKVKSGEVLALSGNSGGQDASAVYFEVRKNSRPQNPLHWLKK
ncbi:peptidoglycan DD-metalloendopeptidase family protein [Vibrio sp.]|nr:peptidoglycan DD-metalloendopeptidase family protein [Vibrio sp.]